MKRKEEPSWYHWGQRPDESQIREAVRLYEEGWSQRQIAKKFNRSQSNIWNWINKFAKDLDNPDMKKKRIRSGKGKAKAQRMTGIMAPETTPESVPQSTPASKDESPEEKIKRLERELADARLARDFYDEMINVAERQFNISIRKKAGTRQ